MRSRGIVVTCRLVVPVLCACGCVCLWLRMRVAVSGRGCLAAPVRAWHLTRVRVPVLHTCATVERLDAEVNKGAVVCLQEVSEDWGGRLLGFFARRGYMFVHGNYGNKFSTDAMGVGVAFPLRSFALVAAELPRVSNTKPWPRPPKPSLLQSALDFALAAPVGAWQGAKQRLKRTAPRIVTNAASAVQSAVTRVLSCGRAGPSVPWGGDTRADIWQAAKGRSNRAVMVRLRHVDAGAEFVVGTYHMPCAFRTPAMMVIHAALIAQKVTRYVQLHVMCVRDSYTHAPQLLRREAHVTATMVLWP